MEPVPTRVSGSAALIAWQMAWNQLTESAPATSLEHSQNAMHAFPAYLRTNGLMLSMLACGLPLSTYMVPHCDVLPSNSAGAKYWPCRSAGGTIRSIIGTAAMCLNETRPPLVLWSP